MSSVAESQCAKSPRCESVTLKEYFERRIDDEHSFFERVIRDQGQRVELAHASAATAVSKAEEATERRLALLNEFRSQSADVSKTFVPRETYDAAMARLSTLEKSVVSCETHAAAMARVGSLERAYWKLAGAAALAALFLPIVTGVIVYLITKH